MFPVCYNHGWFECASETSSHSLWKSAYDLKTKYKTAKGNEITDGGEDLDQEDAQVFNNIRSYVLPCLPPEAWSLKNLWCSLTCTCMSVCYKGSSWSLMVTVVLCCEYADTLEDPRGA